MGFCPLFIIIIIVISIIIIIISDLKYVILLVSFYDRCFEFNGG